MAVISDLALKRACKFINIMTDSCPLEMVVGIEEQARVESICGCKDCNSHDTKKALACWIDYFQDEAKKLLSGIQQLEGKESK